MKKYLGICGLILVTIIWGGGFVASDMALESLSPFQIMTIRFFIATVIMGVIGNKQIKKIKSKEILSGCLLGVFLFAAFALQIIGLQYTTPSKNAFLTAMNVVFVPILAMIFYKKKIDKQSVLGVILAIIGAGILSLQKGFSLGLGDGLSLLCAVSFAFQILLTGRFVGKIRPVVLNFLQMGTAFALSLLGLIFTGGFTMAPTTKGMLSVLYLGVVSTTISYFLQTISQKFVDETKAVIILSMEAVFGTIFSILILQEQITPKMVIGSILILSAVFISEIKVQKKETGEIIVES